MIQPFNFKLKSLGRLWRVNGAPIGNPIGALRTSFTFRQRNSLRTNGAPIGFHIGSLRTSFDTYYLKRSRPSSI